MVEIREKSKIERNMIKFKERSIIKFGEKKNTLCREREMHPKGKGEMIIDKLGMIEKDDNKGKYRIFSIY